MPSIERSTFVADASSQSQQLLACLFGREPLFPKDDPPPPRIHCIPLAWHLQYFSKLFVPTSSQCFQVGSTPPIFISLFQFVRIRPAQNGLPYHLHTRRGTATTSREHRSQTRFLVSAGRASQLQRARAQLHPAHDRVRQHRRCSEAEPGRPGAESMASHGGERLGWLSRFVRPVPMKSLLQRYGGPDFYSGYV
jgi:hypothetical protein